MTAPPKPPREWWITLSTPEMIKFAAADMAWRQIPRGGFLTDAPVVKVIEKSAYEALMSQAQALAAALDFHVSTMMADDDDVPPSEELVVGHAELSAWRAFIKREEG